MEENMAKGLYASKNKWNTGLLIEYATKAS
jgi:hypothetical protein